MTFYEGHLEPLCDRTHLKYGIVAIIRAYKEVWKAYLKRQAVIKKRKAAKEKTKKIPLTLT